MGRPITSPRGVKTKTSALLISNRSESRNSPGSSTSFCQSSSWRSHCMSLSAASSALLSVPVRTSSLYFQCAATPYSARRCIPKVRICISTGLPEGPMTVVCSDWYMLNFGIAT